jgi:hypothetical protein
VTKKWISNDTNSFPRYECGFPAETGFEQVFGHPFGVPTRQLRPDVRLETTAAENSVGAVVIGKF